MFVAELRKIGTQKHGKLPVWMKTLISKLFSDILTKCENGLESTICGHLDGK